MLGLGRLNPGIGWLGHRDLALWAIMAAVVWSLVGFYMVLFVAAIKAVPSEIVEAARLDGCGRFRLAVGVILPMIRENVSTAAVYMGRSEEHTSELQSRGQLVCRLLLEKKKADVSTAQAMVEVAVDDAL